MTTHKRQHQVVLNITMEQPCTQRHACKVVDDLLSGVPHAHHGVTEITNAKPLSRIMLAEKLKADALK